MSDIFQIASIGMLDGRRRLETIGVNAAATALPGFRRHVVADSSFGTAFTNAPAPAAHVNLQTAAPIATGRALDVAIDADELFFALTDGVNTWLTRAGAFHLDADGTLRGEGGLHVVGTQGEVRLPGSDVEIGADGRITQQGVTLATLQLFRPNDRGTLRAATGSLLSAPSGVQPAAAGEGRVRSGELEASNTDAAREMLALISVSRQFEALSRVLQGYDAMLGQAIEKLVET